MKKIANFLVPLAIGFLFTACTTISPSYGIATDARSEKRGEASGTFLFGIIPFPSADISVATAAENGGIKRIATLDTKTTSIFGIIVTKTTIVTGDEGDESVAKSPEEKEAVAKKQIESSNDFVQSWDSADGSVIIDVASLKGKIYDANDEVQIVNATHEKNIPLMSSFSDKNATLLLEA